MQNIPANYYSTWLDKNTADELFAYLLKSVPWQEESILMFGKRIKVPRLICWMADSEYRYDYSGNIHLPQPWLPELKQICNRLNGFLEGAKFNSVLCNLYADGCDYMGWHQDNEPELGKNPKIASISLGAERKFSLRHKQTKQRADMLLEHGSLLVMYSNCQNEWEHSLPKSLKCNLPRVNLTFRAILLNLS